MLFCDKTRTIFTVLISAPSVTTTKTNGTWAHRAPLNFGHVWNALYFSQPKVRMINKDVPTTTKK